MSFVEKALGVHQQALTIGERRLEKLAANIANADTPNFKAQDIDFRAALNRAVAMQDGAALRTSHAAHLPASGGSVTEALRYRIPNHPSLDGNTVDMQMEQAAFAEASVRYQASLDFLAGRIESLRKALRGD
jgi:flagellar basal-body rod protein FlgB